jgi:microcystin-dependent protein
LFALLGTFYGGNGTTNFPVAQPARSGARGTGCRTGADAACHR